MVFDILNKTKECWSYSSVGQSDRLGLSIKENMSACLDERSQGNLSCRTPLNEETPMDSVHRSISCQC